MAVVLSRNMLKRSVTKTKTVSLAGKKSFVTKRKLDKLN